MIDPAAYYSIKQLCELIGGSDRLYRGEIAAARLEAIFTGEWRVQGSDALAWARGRAASRQLRGRPLAATNPPGDGKPEC